MQGLINQPLIRGGGMLTPYKAGSHHEYFYGYYDRSPEYDGKVVMHMVDGEKALITISDTSTRETVIIGETPSWNWQMGARALWLDPDTVSYNDFDGEKYVCHHYSLNDNKIIKTLPMAVMDYCGDRALGVNFRRLISVDPDYSYRCLPEMEDKEFYDYDSDGIWSYDKQSDTKSLLLSINDILACQSKTLSRDGKHCVNHITTSPDGKAFMFIHRYKVNGKKYDRLMVYDFSKLVCLLDDPLQSHFCWLDNNTIMGYGQYNSKVGYYMVDIHSGKVQELEILTQQHPMNGHPTVHGDWVVLDEYPSLSRLQKLIAYNFKNHRYIRLAEVFHDMEHRGYNRCDLHPRFNKEGTKVYFDTIYTGKRQLCSIDIDLSEL